MSIQEFREESSRRHRTTSAGSTSLSSHVLAAYPGERISFGVSLNGPIGHRLRIDAESLPTRVASIAISPKESTAPFTSKVDIIVSPGAPPGVYTFKLRIVDITTNTLLGQESIILIVLRRGLPKTIARHYKRLKTLYLTHGAQALVWYILAHIFRNGATFTQIKHVYEVVVKAPVSNGTIGSILRRMLKKRIIFEKYPGLYIANVKDFNVLLSRIDSSRVRLQAHTKRRNTQRTSETLNEDIKVDFTKLPKPIERVWKRAQEIADEYGALAALYFLLHSLLGAEATGYLLYWLDTWFIVCRSKTGFCFHFYSILLHEMLRRLGLREGILYNYFRKWQHLEAQKIAQEYIRRYYISHPSARRLHYMLKKLKYIRYDNDIYTLKIYHYEDGSMGLEIYDERGEELLHQDSIKNNIAVTSVETKTAFPFEHIDKKSENTYFYRPAGLY